MMAQEKYIAAPIDAPSPLVGEGKIVASNKHTWVRGSLHRRIALCGENPSSGASRHLLPQGEKEEAHNTTRLPSSAAQ